MKKVTLRLCSEQAKNQDKTNLSEDVFVGPTLLSVQNLDIVLLKREVFSSPSGEINN